VKGYTPDTFTWSHVNKLAEGVERAFPSDTVLVVMRDEWFADKPDERHPLIVEVDLPPTHSGGWTPWLELFDGDTIPEGERCVYVGIDTVFVEDCGWLFDWDACPVGLIPDPFKPHQAATCVVTADRHGAHWIEEEYRFRQGTKFHGCKTRGRPSDWIMLRNMQSQHQWPMLDSPRIRSFKQHTSKKDGGKIPPGTSLVYCHGEPRPWEIPEGHPVRETWEGR